MDLPESLLLVEASFQVEAHWVTLSSGAIVQLMKLFLVSFTYRIDNHRASL